MNSGKLIHDMSNFEEIHSTVLSTQDCRRIAVVYCFYVIGLLPVKYSHHVNDYEK